MHFSTHCQICHESCRLLVAFYIFKAWNATTIRNYLQTLLVRRCLSQENDMMNNPLLQPVEWQIKSFSEKHTHTHVKQSLQQRTTPRLPLEKKEQHHESNEYNIISLSKVPPQTILSSHHFNPSKWPGVLYRNWDPHDTKRASSLHEPPRLSYESSGVRDRKKPFHHPTIQIIDFTRQQKTSWRLLLDFFWGVGFLGEVFFSFLLGRVVAWKDLRCWTG